MAVSVFVWSVCRQANNLVVDPVERQRAVERLEVPALEVDLQAHRHTQSREQTHNTARVGGR